MTLYEFFSFSFLFLCFYLYPSDNVAVSVDQFYTIRESIRATIHMEQEQIRRDKLKADELAKKINSMKKEPGNTDKDKIADRINANGDT